MKKDSKVMPNCKNKKLSKTNWFYILILSLLIVYSVVMAVILLWALSTSLKTYPQFRKDPLYWPSGWPWEWNWNSFAQAFEHFKVSKGTGKGDAYLAEMFIYSFVYSFGCAFMATLIPMVTAYTTQKFDLKFSRLLYFIVIVTMSIPIIGALPAQIQMSKNLGIYNEVGSIKVGKRANITILDKNSFEVLMTIRNGKVVYKK